MFCCELSMHRTQSRDPSYEEEMSPSVVRKSDVNPINSEIKVKDLQGSLARLRHVH